jgi:hypothetical protein
LDQFFRFRPLGLQPRSVHSWKKVNFFFLLEIAIAIGLASILFTFLFRFLVSYATIEKKIETAQIVLLERQRMQEKLETIFTSIESAKIDGAGIDGPSFYTALFPDEKVASLIVLFNAGIDPDPAFSGSNTGRLYLNERDEFCLTQWTLSKNDYRTEVLLKDVRALEWEFLGHKEEKDTKAIPISGSWGWLPLWPKKQSGVPTIIRLKLWGGIDKKKKSGPNLQFAFILPNQEPVPIYK